MTKRYAEATEVPVTRSKQQVEALLVQHKAEGFHTGWDAQRDIIEFLWKGKQIRFVLPRPDRKDFKFTRSGAWRNDRQITQAIEQAERQRWRALYLVIRAKLESVEAGIAVFEEEFMAFIVVPGRNQTVGELLLPRIAAGSFDISHALPAAAGE
jgi:hypothetical protein